MLITSPAITPRCFTAQQLSPWCCLQFSQLIIFWRWKIFRVHRGQNFAAGMQPGDDSFATLHADEPDAGGTQNQVVQRHGYPAESRDYRFDLFLLFFWQKTIFAFFLGLVIVEGVFLVQYLPALARRDLLSLRMFDFSFLRTAVVFSLPLMAAEISWVVLDSGDRFFIQHYMGLQALGFYAAAYGIAIYLQDVMMAPLQLALFPICMKVWNTEGKEATQKFLSRSLDQFVLVAVAVVCVAIVTSRDVIVLLASRKFQEAHTLLPFLVIGLVLSAVTIFFRPGLLIYKRASKIAAATFYACVLNIVLNIILLPRIGLLGAAIATMISYGGIVVFLAYQSLGVLPYKLELAALRAMQLWAAWLPGW